MTIGGNRFTSNGAGDIFVARFTKNGNSLWSRSYGDGFGQYVTGVAADSSGHVILTGRTAGGLNLGIGCALETGAVFLAKLSASSGACVWAKSLPVSYTVATSVAPGDGVLVTGSFSGDVTLGGGVLSSPSEDTFVARFDAAGNHEWSIQSIGGSAAVAMAVGADRVAVTGTLYDSATFGGPTIGPGPTGWDIFVTTLDATSGAHQWSTASESVGAVSTSARAVTVDPLGNVIVVGQFDATLTFGSLTISPTDGLDGFVGQFDAQDGAENWLRQVGGAGKDVLTAVASDSQGNVVFTGYIHDSASVGADELVVSDPIDLILAKLRPDGEHAWSTLFIETGVHQGHTIAVGSLSEIAVATESADGGSIDFGGGALTSGIILSVLGP